MILDNEGKPMIPVHICWDDGEAQVVAGYLKSHGFHAVINSEIPHSVLPLTANGLGEVRVLVPAADKDAARQYLEDRPVPASETE